MNIANTETVRNLVIAFGAESHAQTRYNCFAKRASSEGYCQIAAAFKQVADQEAIHLRCLFDLLCDCHVQILPAYCPCRSGSTIDNLIAAAVEENYFTTEMYPEFADIAELQGLPGIADLFWSLAMAEYMHEDIFLELVEEITDSFYSSTVPTAFRSTAFLTASRATRVT